MTFNFDDSRYIATYGKAPRGYGSRAFAIEGAEPEFAPCSTYAAARVWARGRAKELAPLGYSRVVNITVCT